MFQNADESLADVLKQRALTPEEATEALRCTARALEELHANGLVHGCVSPAEVLAVDDFIKLSTENVREVNGEPILDYKTAKYLAPESGTRNLTIASDMWCLGATLYEMLTQKKYEPGLYGDAIALRHPFGTVAERCLESDPDKRCKMAELESILRSKPQPAKPKPASTPTQAAPDSAKAATVAGIASNGAPSATPHVRAESPVAEVRPDFAESQVTKEAPLRTGIPVQSGSPVHGIVKETSSAAKPADHSGSSSLPNRVSETTRRIDEPGGSFTGRRGLFYAVGAFIVVFLVLWMIRGRSTAKAPATLPTQSKVSDNATEASNQPKPAWPTKTLSPDAKENKPNATPMERGGPSLPVQSGEKTIWRVILYTYNHQADAENRARELVGKRPDLQAQVFSSSNSGGPYLVIAGGKMNRAEAATMRQRALREGMPRDTYIQNYNK